MKFHQRTISTQSFPFMVCVRHPLLESFSTLTSRKLSRQKCFARFSLSLFLSPPYPRFISALRWCLCFQLFSPCVGGQQKRTDTLLSPARKNSHARIQIHHLALARWWLCGPESWICRKEKSVRICSLRAHLCVVDSFLIFFLIFPPGKDRPG